MSEYFTLPTAIPPASLAKSSDINAVSDAVGAGFDSLPTDLGGLKNEVIAARDGKASLLLKEKAQDDAISAVEILATTGFPSQAANAGKFLFTNGATPEWGDPIPGQTGNTGKFLSTDGTVSEWLPVKNLENATASDRTIFNAATTTYIAKARLSDTQTLYAYRDPGGTGKAVVATSTTLGITLSNEVAFTDVAGTIHISANPLSATQAAMSWYDSASTYDAYIRVLTYDSTTNTLSVACDPYTYHTQASEAAIYSACCAISSSKIAIFYNNPADSDKLYGQVLSWNGSALSVVTSNVMIHTNAPASLIQSELISGNDTSGKMFITVTYGVYSYMGVISWTSTSGFTAFSNGATAVVVTQYAPIVVLDSNAVIVFSRHFDAAHNFIFGELYLFYVGGTSPVLVKKHQFTKTGNTTAVRYSAGSATKIADGKAAVMLCSNNEYEHTLFVFSANAPSNKVNASNIELLTEQTFSRYSNSYFTLSKTTDNNLLYAYMDSDNSAYGTIEKIEVDL